MDHKPDQHLIDHARAAWGWTELTDDELRALWVLERFLAEQNRRIYHLPWSPAPTRYPNSHGFRFAVNSFGSFDGSGLAALTIAAFAASVRVEVDADSTLAIFDHEACDTIHEQWFDNAPYEVVEDNGLVQDLATLFEWMAQSDPMSLSPHHRSVLTLTLNPRKGPNGHTFERHPGVTELNSRIIKMTAPETDEVTV